MARINVEESALIMARRLGLSMEWDEDLALGKLTRFWHDSQAEEVTECRHADLSIWFRFPFDQVDRLARALVASMALEETSEGAYRIRGNEKHIQSLRQRREAARENGKNGGRPPKEPTQKPGRKPTRDIGKKPNVTQPKPAEQSSSEQSKKDIVAPSATTQLWDHYYRGLEKKGVKAVHQGGKTGKLLKTLVDRHGDYATALVDAFLNDQDSFVSDQAWSLGLLVAQDQKYAAKANKRVTGMGLLTFGEEEDGHAADVRST